MTTSLLWFLALGPVALAAVAVLPSPDARTTARRAFLVAAANGILAVFAAAAWATAGPLRTPTLGLEGAGLALSLDALSTTLMLLVAFVGTVVIRFARNYLAGDPGHDRFLRGLALALAAVTTLVLSGNLVQLGLAWAATSIVLGRLLLFYPDRTNAVLAARKKFVVSRIGDLCLLGAMAALWSLFGTLDLHAIAEGARALAASGSVPPAAHAAGLLVVAAALLKSAQFPLHGWILEVMETPTPVSALLHAGIINAGGFLVLRFADLVALSGPALGVLVVIGATTAVFGSVVMLTQTSVKVALAYSTIAQMGFMMLQCGLGAWSAALLHIVAHSLYKAHAFLSSGSVVDRARAAWYPEPGERPHPLRTAVVAGAVVVGGFAAATATGTTITASPGPFTLVAVLVLGLAVLMANAADRGPLLPMVGRAALAAGLVTVTYVVLQAGAVALTAGTLPAPAALGSGLDLVMVALVVLGFAVTAIIQLTLPFRPESQRWQAWHAHVANGFYVNTIANRLVIGLWPVPVPASAANTPR